MRTPVLARTAACSMLAICSAAGAEILSYDPALGSLPQAQGWTFAGTFNAPMNVGGGQLTYGATTVGGTTAWAFDPIDAISFATQTIFIEARIRLTGADFGNFSGFRRGGFSLFLEDDAGRWIIADLGDNRISLGNDDTRLSDPVATLDLSSGFRTVRLEAGPSGGRLLVDGVQMLTLALGTGQTGGARTSWGEGTTLANANLTEVQAVRFVPTPASLAPAFLALPFACRRRR